MRDDVKVLDFDFAIKKRKKKNVSFIKKAKHININDSDGLWAERLVK